MNCLQDIYWAHFKKSVSNYLTTPEPLAGLIAGIYQNDKRKLVS